MPARVANPVGMVHRRRRRRLAALGLLALAALGGWLWLRDAPLLRVREVTVTGVASADERQIRAALRSAAREMTTLHVREDALRRAVAEFPSVADLDADPDFPRGLAIEVRERQPVAVVEAGAQRVPATAAGLLLRGLRVRGTLPRIAARRLPPGRRITEARALAALDVAGTAPPALRARLARVGPGPRGLTAELRDGPALVFGSPRRLRAKWAAAAAVLARPDATGATHIDLRVPERPAAGGLAPIATPQP